MEWLTRFELATFWMAIKYSTNWATATFGGDIQNRTEDERLQSSRFTIKLYRQISFPEDSNLSVPIRYALMRAYSLPGWAPETMDPVTGIGPVSSAWKADILPLNYTELFEIYLSSLYKYYIKNFKKNQIFMVPAGGIEPPTSGIWIRGSTNWATQAFISWLLHRVRRHLHQ